LAVVGKGEKLMIIDDEKVQPFVSFSIKHALFKAKLTNMKCNLFLRVYMQTTSHKLLIYCKLDKLETTMGGRQATKDTAEVSNIV